MIDTQQQIKLSIVHDQSLQHAQKKCCEVSVPLPQSLVLSLEQLSVNTVTVVDGAEKTKAIDSLCQIIAYWPDNSLKWIKLTYQYCNQSILYLNIIKTPADIPYLSTQKLIYDTAFSNDSEIISDIYYNGGVNALTLSLANNQFEILDDGGKAILSLSADDLKLTDSSGQVIKTNFSHASLSEQTNLKDQTSSSVKIVVDGHFAQTLVQFQLIVDWLIPFDLIKFDLQIHNTNRAIHAEGKWDLGDPGSFNFKAFNIQLNTTKSSLKKHSTLTNVESKHSYSADSIVCEQLSSGGLNWQSPVHVNKNNTVDINQNGYVLSFGQEKLSGMRCQPVLALKNNLVVTIDKFWQNFPKSLSVKDNIVILSLFPTTHYLHELQGGEKKTHTFWLSLNSSKNDLTNNHKVNRGTIAWDWVSQCGLYPFFQKEKTDLDSLQSIIDLGIDNTSGFIAKRENLDEYGWRNFGELYADHETAGHEGEDIFVSHYNNQYDPIYGFLRQYLTTGNSKWFELADDLAKHVKDIDMYHTSLDKKEYNGGLFWHTDHYLAAFTAGHRSYSKYQSNDAYQDHTGSGGPGGQHCYTTGLYLHYCLTGSQSSKQAVLTLSQWITNVYDGSNTFLELLLALKKRNEAGHKNHFTGQYPLDRGCAHYVIALLDSYELTQQMNYLKQVESILTNTMHPDEDICSRNLHDVENTWFYTVLLQALCRYLHVKFSLGQIDQHFYYCRDCLLNFADWMILHEYPYLDKTEILEYPNDTWVAQDLRKAHILAGAYYFAADERIEYITKAHFFEQYVAEKLNISNTRTYTRILVLLMQNQGAVDVYKTRDPHITFVSRQTWPVAKYQVNSVYGGFIKQLFKRLGKLSLKGELEWLKKRLN
ncbi:MAG: hypothetical protein ACI9VT_002354 [Psychroserpens sp.]|jgi:hypothetical protein